MSEMLPAVIHYETQVDCLDQADQAAQQAQLWEILADQSQRYTMGESTSLPEDTVRELLQSIHFCIGLRLKGGRKLTDAPLRDLFAEGQKQAWAMAQRGKAILETVIRHALPFDNLSYQDTLAALPAFFRLYDYRFFAHQIPCMIAYQLCAPAQEDLQGVEFMLDYLRRLHAENLFCSRFPPETLAGLLRAYTPDSRELLINLTDAVFPNAVGRVLVGKAPLPPLLDDRDLQLLAERFHPWDSGRAAADMAEAVAALCAGLGLDGPVQAYLQEAGAELLVRVQTTRRDHYNGIFLNIRL